MSKLYFRYGAMNAAKSAQLLAAAHNYEELGYKPLLLNFKDDTRYGEGRITSRLGVSKESVPFDPRVNLYDLLQEVGPPAVFIDEAQFLTTKQVKDLHEYVITYKIPVLCYGLRTDFQGNLFEGSAALLAHAESIEEIKTVCKCGKKATHVARYVNGIRQLQGSVVEIGDTNYQSMCYTCWYDELLNEEQRYV